MYRNKWVTWAAVLFVVYSATKSSIKTASTEIKDYFKQPSLFSYIPPQQLQEKKEDKKNLQTSKPDSTEKYPTLPFTIMARNDEKDLDPNSSQAKIRQKILEFLNHAIRGPIGQKLTESMILIQPRDPKDRNFVVNPYNNNTAIDLEKGEGEQAKCGQTVKLDLSVMLSNGTLFSNTRDTKKPIVFTIGEGKVIPGLENIVVGMRKGGFRKAVIPPSLGYGSPRFYNNNISQNEYIILEVDLLNISPTLAKKTSFSKIENLKINDENHAYKCGDEVEFYYTLKIENSSNLLVDKSPPSVYKVTKAIVGDKKLPYCLNLVLDRMTYNGSRSITFKPDLLKNAQGKETSFFSSNIKVKKEENLVLTVQTFKVVKE